MLLFKPPSLWGFAVADEPTKSLRNGWGSQLLDAYRPAGPKPASRKVEEGKKKKTEKSHEKGKGSFSRDHANQTAKAAAAASTRLGKQQSSSGWGVTWPCST